MTTLTEFEHELLRFFRGVVFSEYEAERKLDITPGALRNRLSELQKAGNIRLVQARMPRRFNIWRLKK